MTAPHRHEAKQGASLASGILRSSIPTRRTKFPVFLSCLSFFHVDISFTFHVDIGTASLASLRSARSVPVPLFPARAKEHSKSTVPRYSADSCAVCGIPLGNTFANSLRSFALPSKLGFASPCFSTKVLRWPSPLRKFLPV